jgi:uncharacterized repeat protein (TIGR03803 family)
VPDGANPGARLTAYGGALYGTTVTGGAENDGTIFRISESGETILHNFGNDGSEPFGGMVAVNGALYGTTSGGGTQNYGTIFRFQL